MKTRQGLPWGWRIRRYADCYQVDHALLLGMFLWWPIRHFVSAESARAYIMGHAHDGEIVEFDDDHR